MRLFLRAIATTIRSWFRIKGRARAAEAEAKRKAEEERARAAAEVEAHRQAEEAGRLAAEAEAKRKAEERARVAAEAGAHRQAEEAGRLAAEAEAKRKAEERARAATEAEARRRAEEAARLAAEAEAKRKVEERARAAAEAEAHRQAEEAARLAAEAEAKHTQQADRTRPGAEAEARRRPKRKAVGGARRKVAVASRSNAIDETRRAALSEARRRAREAAHLNGERNVNGSLRLCAMLDRVAGAASFTLRATMNREFPETGLMLKRESSEEKFFCEGELLQWSTPLRDAESPARTDGARFDWSVGIELRDEQLGWRFRLQGRPVRLFRNGEAEGLRGLLEVSQLSPGVPFVIAARSDCWQRLEAWGQSSCRQFDRVPVRHGMPEGWGLYCAAAADSDEQVRNDFPNLAIPHAVRLLLRGGIHGGRGSTYFHFSLPIVLVEGGTGRETIRCNGGMDLQQDDGIYHLPEGLPSGVPICVEVSRAARVLKRRSLIIVDDFEWQWSTPCQMFDKFGSPVDLDEATPVGMAGAAVPGVHRARPLFSPPKSCFERRPGGGARRRWGRVFFVGSVPGQIVSWPREALPTDWIPVWAIPMSRRGRVLFCGPDRGDAVLVSGAPYPRKKVRLWKEIVHYCRKKITPPSDASCADLWQRFQDEARRVRA